MNGRRPSLFYRVFVLIVTGVVTTSALIVFVIGFAVYKVNQNVNTDVTLPATQTSQQEQPLQESVLAVAEPVGEDYINVLLIGTDREQDGVSRADVIMVCSVDPVNNRMLITSFLRDLYLPIPGYGENRINASYAFGGAELLKKCLEQNFGITTDYTVQMGFEGFAAVIDGLGGVPMELTEEEATYLGIAPGVQTLNGEKALQYVRLRAVGNGDFDRTQRQQKMLSAIGIQFSAADMTKIYKSLKGALGNITTDLGFGDILKLLPDVVAAIGKQQCESLQIPVQDGYTNSVISGMQVLVPDMAVNQKALADKIA